jgi:hypothetical protein
MGSLKRVIFLIGVSILCLAIALPSVNASIANEKVKAWYNNSYTYIQSVATGDVDADGQVEIITGGHSYDGTRYVAQLCVWNGATMALENSQSWYWTGTTYVWAVAVGDVDGDGQVEIVTGGSFYDGTRNVAQLIEWTGSGLAVERLTSWYWTGNTEIQSVAIGDTDADGQIEIVTGGNFYDGSRTVAQLIEWKGSTLAVDRLTTWYWTGNTNLRSIAIGDVDTDGKVEVVSGGYYYDGTRNVAQLVVWSGSSLVAERIQTWYWTSNTAIFSIALGDVDRDGVVEIVTGGGFNDGSRVNSQFVVWNGKTLSAENVKSWYWTGNTQVWSVAIGDVDYDGAVEIVTAGYFNDGTRSNAPLIVWNGSTLALENNTS